MLYDLELLNHGNVTLEDNLQDYVYVEHPKTIKLKLSPNLSPINIVNFISDLNIEQYYLSDNVRWFKLSNGTNILSHCAIIIRLAK